MLCYDQSDVHIQKQQSTPLLQRLVTVLRNSPCRAWLQAFTARSDWPSRGRRPVRLFRNRSFTIIISLQPQSHRVALSLSWLLVPVSLMSKQCQQTCSRLGCHLPLISLQFSGSEDLLHIEFSDISQRHGREAI